MEHKGLGRMRHNTGLTRKNTETKNLHKRLSDRQINGQTNIPVQTIKHFGDTL